MTTVRRVLILAATAYVVFVLVLDVLAVIGWPDGGPVALAQVLSAHLTLLAIALVPLAFLHGAAVLRVALAVLLVVSLARFGGEWMSVPSIFEADAPELEVMTWNLEIGSRAPQDAIAFLRPATAKVIALQELTPAVSAAIAADSGLAVRYPYKALYPSADVLGLGLLSAYPLSAVSFEDGPSRLLATVDAPAGSIRVVDVHPLPARIARGPFGVPLDFDPSDRDAALDRIRDAVATDAVELPVVLLGDINTAPTEPEFGRFMAGYRDAHAEIGQGPGWTYRPDQLEPLGFGLIRIDVVLSGPGLRPTAETTRCPPIGDHCAVIATIAVETGLPD
jgi:endonuclease/exonuclease/phosphatase (EEP) superfamily protein YafD